MSDAGVFDTARGTFSELWRVESGTGLLAGATGDLFAFGFATETGLGGDVRGHVCVPGHHGH